jgi:hypothetical protein
MLSLKRNARRIEAITQWVMVGGIVALVQPWSLLLHRYGVTIILIGLVGFIVFSHVHSEPEDE